MRSALLWMSGPSPYLSERKGQPVSGITYLPAVLLQEGNPHVSTLPRRLCCEAFILLGVVGALLYDEGKKWHSVATCLPVDAVTAMSQDQIPLFDPAFKQILPFLVTEMEHEVPLFVHLSCS
ncbi:hypothetical protein AB1N83_008215 [Pleurotus pulmonarius]